jgi:hypothetical protein
MRAGNWRLALRIAAKFDRLGPRRNAILSAHEAYVRPDFYRQLGRDVKTMRAAGRRALVERYGR